MRTNLLLFIFFFLPFVKPLAPIKEPTESFDIATLVQ